MTLITVQVWNCSDDAYAGPYIKDIYIHPEVGTLNGALPLKLMGLQEKQTAALE